MAKQQRTYEVKVRLHKNEAGNRSDAPTATIVTIEVDEDATDEAAEKAARLAAEKIFHDHLGLEHPVAHSELVRVK